VDVAPGRLGKWIDGFRSRHGDYASTVADDGTVVLRAVDGALAECFGAPGMGTINDLESFVAGAAVPRRIGLVLARKAAVAVGVAVGGELVTSKVDTSYEQSRTAAGGWSQHRFARRRDNQAKAAAGSASDLVVRLLVPEAGRLVAVVTGGDRKTIETILADRRLDKVSALVADRFLDVPEPRLAVLETAASSARAVRIRITDPD
jgi:hypothetical protein